MQYKVIARAVAAVLISLNAMGCIEYSLDDPGIIADVDISRVVVSPDTVVVGDTLLVEVVFNRGEGKKLNITWLMPETEITPVIIRTDTRDLAWRADVEPGIYIGIVSVDDEMTNDGAVSQRYPFTVVSRE